MKKKLAFLVICIALFAVVLSSCTDIVSVELADNPTLVFECDKTDGKICYGATGFLYGMSEPDVPSGELISGLSSVIAAVKAPDGKQHPVGDVLKVAEYYVENGGQKLFIYMQDIYPEWYYVYRGQADYLEKIETMMVELAASEYSENFIYCPFNENDNGAWYGDFSSQASRNLFYDDWKVIYNAIKQADPEAYIAGPGYCNYKESYISDFLTYCKANECMPDMMVWHELSSDSYKNYESNYNSYRAVEKTLNIAELEICISEYGRMSDNGIPGQMIQFLSMFEKTKVYACVAYWRLANNLCELAADNNTPSGAWWLYYWYGQMQGNTYSAERKNVKSDGFNGFSSYDDSTQEMTLLVGGQTGIGDICINDISALSGYKNNQKVQIEVEYVDYYGLGSDCYSPVKKARYTGKIKDNSLIIRLDDMSATKAYRIVVSQYDGASDYVNECEAIRYEAEEATGDNLTKILFRSRFVKGNLTYASSNEEIVLTANGKNKLNSLSFEINAETSGEYRIDIAYCNDYKETSTDSSTRTTAKAHVKVDNKDTTLLYDNTISNETGAMKSIYVNLKEGKHTVTLYKGSDGVGDLSYDFIDVTKIGEDSSSQIFTQQMLRESTNSLGYRYMAVVPTDGYYGIAALGDMSAVNVSGKKIDLSSGKVYLKKGINYITTNKNVLAIKIYSAKETVTTAELTVSGEVSYSDSTYSPSGKATSCVSGVDNYIEWTINASKAGTYALTFYYSNNEEIGEHSYNVQHVEKYATISVNGTEDIYYFRNTFSWDTFKTKTIYVQLQSGNNTIKVYNDESYIWNGNEATMPMFAKMDYAILVK